MSHGVPGGDEHYELVALDAASGVPRWRWPAPTPDRLFVGAVAGGFVYPTSEDHTVYRLDASTGKGGRWYRAGGSISSLPAIVDDTMYVSSADGTVHAVDLATGTVRWTREVRGSPTMPVVTRGRAIVATSVGEVVAFGSP